jgi:hypothetical protein
MNIIIQSVFDSLEFRGLYPYAGLGPGFVFSPRLPEYNPAERCLLDNVPVDGLAGPVEPPQHRGITGVLNGGIEIGLDEIEEGLEM